MYPIKQSNSAWLVVMPSYQNMAAVYRGKTKNNIGHIAYMTMNIATTQNES